MRSGTSATFGRGWPGSVSCLHQDKTRLVEVWPVRGFEPAASDGVGKPETFDFLGLTHYCTTTLRGRLSYLVANRLPNGFNRTLARIDEVLRKRWHHDIL